MQRDPKANPQIETNSELIALLRSSEEIACRVSHLVNQHMREVTGGALSRLVDRVACQRQMFSAEPPTTTAELAAELGAAEHPRARMSGPSGPRTTGAMGKVLVDTTEFEASHGRQPRGRGSWAFGMGSTSPDALWWSHSCTYAEARRAAVAEARERKIGTVFVMS